MQLEWANLIIFKYPSYRWDLLSGQNLCFEMFMNFSSFETNMPLKLCKFYKSVLFFISH